MPGTAIKRHKLDHATITLNQQVSGYFQTFNLSEERMPARVQSVGKQLGNMTTAKLPWWQADIVDHQQRNFAIGTLVAVWGRYELRIRNPVISYGKAHLVQRVYSDSILRLPCFR